MEKFPGTQNGDNHFLVAKPTLERVQEGDDGQALTLGANKSSRVDY